MAFVKSSPHEYLLESRCGFEQRDLRTNPVNGAYLRGVSQATVNNERRTTMEFYLKDYKLTLQMILPPKFPVVPPTARLMSDRDSVLPNHPDIDPSEGYIDRSFEPGAWTPSITIRSFVRQIMEMLDAVGAKITPPLTTVRRPGNKAVYGCYKERLNLKQWQYEHLTRKAHQFMEQIREDYCCRIRFFGGERRTQHHTTHLMVEADERQLVSQALQKLKSYVTKLESARLEERTTSEGTSSPTKENKPMESEQQATSSKPRSIVGGVLGMEGRYWVAPMRKYTAGDNDYAEASSSRQPTTGAPPPSQTAMTTGATVLEPVAGIPTNPMFAGCASVATPVTLLEPVAGIPTNPMFARCASVATPVTLLEPVAGIPTNPMFARCASVATPVTLLEPVAGIPTNPMFARCASVATPVTLLEPVAGIPTNPMFARCASVATPVTLLEPVAGIPTNPMFARCASVATPVTLLEPVAGIPTNPPLVACASVSSKNATTKRDISSPCEPNTSTNRDADQGTSGITMSISNMSLDSTGNLKMSYCVYCYKEMPEIAVKIHQETYCWRAPKTFHTQSNTERTVASSSRASEGTGSWGLALLASYCSRKLDAIMTEIENRLDSVTSDVETKLGALEDKYVDCVVHLLLTKQEEQDTRQMERRLGALAERNKCSICLVREKNHVLGCGHMLCQECVVDLNQRVDAEERRCPLCREAIQHAWRVLP